MHIYSKILSAFCLAILLSLSGAVHIAPANAAVDPVSNVKPIYSQGLKFLKTRRFKQAIEKFSKTILTEPSKTRLRGLALYHRGLAHQALGQLLDARKDYSRAIKLRTLKDKVLKVVYYNRGLVHDGLKRPNAALADFVSAIDKNPKFSPAYHNMGNVLRKMGKHKRAIKNFLISLELGNPQPYLTYLGLAMAYEGVGRNNEAITSLKYALDVRPRFKKASEMLARLTTQDIYTFPTQSASPPDNDPIVTGSLPANATSNEVDKKQLNKNTNYVSHGLQLRGLVETKNEPVEYKKLALRGSVASSSFGRVAVVVPGPGLEQAQKGLHSTILPKKKPGKGNFKAQLGVSKTSAKANKIWFFLKAQHGDLLKNLKPTFQRVQLGEYGHLYRIQVGPFSSRQAAERLCEKIKERAVNCFSV